MSREPEHSNVQALNVQVKRREGLNRKRIAVLCGAALAVILIAGLAYLRYQNSHSAPFERNGTKQAVLFLERGTNQAHDAEYAAITRVTVDGEVRRPVFRDASFTGRIEVAWFDEQDIIKPNAARKAETMLVRGGITEVWLRQRPGGADSHAVPSVDLRYFFAQDDENEIVRVTLDDWRDGEEKTCWAVTGTEDVEQARKALENFLEAVQAQGI